MCEIAGERNLKELSSLELVMIICVALLHDVGMRISDDYVSRIEGDEQYKFYLNKHNGNQKLAIQDFVRPLHGTRSYDYIMNDDRIGELLYDNRLTTVSFREDIALVCQSHMENLEWINNNLKESFSKGDHFNSKYIALLLRIADYIDFDSQRAPRYLLEQKQLNRISQIEWEKHATVCNINKIDHNSEEIFFDIECDDFNLYCKLMDTIDTMNKEVYECVHYSESFSEKKYHFHIKDSIRINTKTKGFFPELFTFELDYYNVTNLLMGENLYGEKTYGLRELVQNSLDACNVMKEICSKKDPTIKYIPEIKIIFDYDNSKVHVKDNGTGMSKEIIKKYFLTVGKSYYMSDEYKKLGYNAYPTGTFGIGFLSCFMLSSEVEVKTKYYSNDEESSFRLEKNSKYICHLTNAHLDSHGTSISLSMAEFSRVFSADSLNSFINENFYQLDANVEIYRKENNKYTLMHTVSATRLTSYLDIDLSKYLEGVECKASIHTVIDEFELFNCCPTDTTAQNSNAVLISNNNIQLVRNECFTEYVRCRCIILKTSAAFEALLKQFFCDSEMTRLGNYGLDLDELIEYFENYGFSVFAPDFNTYDAEDDKEQWEGSYFYNSLQICVFIDPSIDDAYIENVLHEARIRYLIDTNCISNIKADSYVALSHKVYGTDVEDEWTSDNPSKLEYYETRICHRGVLLNNVELSIPSVAALISDYTIAVNIMRSEFKPSVTRSGLTPLQKQILSYAIGKAIHKYLLEVFSDDEIILNALNRLIERKYASDNEFCRTDVNAQ